MAVSNNTGRQFALKINQVIFGYERKSDAPTRRISLNPSSIRCKSACRSTSKVINTYTTEPTVNQETPAKIFAVGRADIVTPKLNTIRLNTFKQYSSNMLPTRSLKVDLIEMPFAAKVFVILFVLFISIK